MNPRTELVMGRYRELKREMSGLEASRVVLQEAQAGTLGVTQTVTQHGVTQAENVRVCNGCGKEFSNRGDICNACRQKAYRERR
jgi:rRNA maturation endonuclease Nob1